METQTLKNPENKLFEKALEKMSPFEIKGTLISLAEKDAQLSTATFLNAGRGNPNWLLTRPRKAFFLLGIFAVSEAERNFFDKSLSTAVSPSKDGVAKRFLEFVDAHKGDEGSEVLSHHYN